MADTRMTEAELQAAYNDGQRNFYCVNLEGADLEHICLGDVSMSLANLRGANLTGARLKRADLRGAVLVGATLTDADLTDADLTGADLTGANLRYTNLQHAELRATNLTQADIYETVWYFADLESAVFSGCHNPPTSSHDFISAVLRNAAGNDIEKLKIAGLVSLMRHWCWEDMRESLVPTLTSALKAWIVETLAGQNGWPDTYGSRLRAYGFTNRTTVQTVLDVQEKMDI